MSCISLRMACLTRRRRSLHILRNLTHQQVSFFKSGIRIIGYILIIHDLVLAALVLTASELVGIYEEIGH